MVEHTTLCRKLGARIPAVTKSLKQGLVVPPMENTQWHIQMLKVLPDDSKTDVLCHNFANYDSHMIGNIFVVVAYVGVAFNNCQSVV